MAQNNQVANVTKSWLNSPEIKKQMEVYCNPAISPREFLTDTALLFAEKQELRDCLKTDAGKASLLHTMKFAARTGLSLNPMEGKAALIAYNGRVSYQVMKNGIVELAERSGKVASITCDTVRELDEFRVTKSSRGDEFSFSPARKDRGEIDGFFAAVVLKDGTCHVKYMTRVEVEDHRDKYSAMYKHKPQASPWNNSFEGMAQKTVIKSLFRNVKISPDIEKALHADDGDVLDIDDGPSMVSEKEKTQAEEVEGKIVDGEKRKEPEPDQDNLF